MRRLIGSEGTNARIKYGRNDKAGLWFSIELFGVRLRVRQKMRPVIRGKQSHIYCDDWDGFELPNYAPRRKLPSNWKREEQQ